jgi:hypothetical protein
VCFDFRQKWVGLLLGRFFTNSSGRPDSNAQFFSKMTDPVEWKKLLIKPSSEGKFESCNLDFQNIDKKNFEKTDDVDFFTSF